MGYYKVRVNVKDQHNSPVVGAKATLTKDGRGQGYPNSFTDSNGNAYFYDVVSGIQFMYKVVAPSGYSCVTCAKLHTLSDKDIWTQMEMKKAAAPNFDLHVLCEDQNNNKLQNVAITINNVHRGYTSSSGTFSVSLPGNQQYDVKGVKSGYENGFDSVYLSSSKVANLTLKYSDPFVCSEGAKKDYESCFDGTYVYKTVCRDNKWIPTGDTCPEEGIVDCFVAIDITDENGNPLIAKVCVPGTEGPDCQTTLLREVIGITVADTTFQLKQNTQYTATVTKAGYVDYSGFSSKSFTTPNYKEDNISLRLTKLEETCPDVDAKFEATAPWRDAAQTEFAIGETIEVGDTSISDEEIVKAVWNWGDGSSTSGSAGFWNFISTNTFHAEHEYSTSGKKTIVYTATNKCGSKDIQSFYINILSAAEIESYITAPSTVKAGESFIVTVHQADEGTPYKIKIGNILDAIYAKTIGEGSVESDGCVDISCMIGKTGDYKIFGYDPGNILPGGFVTPDIDITVTETGEPVEEPTPGNFRIDAPSIVLTEKEFIVSGIHPKPGQSIDIMQTQTFTDDIIGSGVVDDDGKFEIACIIDEFGFDTIYAYDKTWLEEWWLAAYIPAGWIPGKGATSNEKFIIVLNWTVIIMVILMVALILEKQYNYLGVFKK